MPERHPSRIRNCPRTGPGLSISHGTPHRHPLRRSPHHSTACRRRRQIRAPPIPKWNGARRRVGTRYKGADFRQTTRKRNRLPRLRCRPRPLWDNKQKISLESLLTTCGPNPTPCYYSAFRKFRVNIHYFALKSNPKINVACVDRPTPVTDVNSRAKGGVPSSETPSKPDINKPHSAARPAPHEKRDVFLTSNAGSGTVLPAFTALQGTGIKKSCKNGASL